MASDVTTDSYDRNGVLRTTPGRMTFNTICVYYKCPNAATIVVSVLSGDADDMHDTDNPLCSQHSYLVTGRWLGELMAGGPVHRYTVVRAIIGS